MQGFDPLLLARRGGEKGQGIHACVCYRLDPQQRSSSALYREIHHGSGLVVILQCRRATSPTSCVGYMVHFGRRLMDFVNPGCHATPDALGSRLSVPSGFVPNSEVSCVELYPGGERARPGRYFKFYPRSFV
jgi:hypothetical protein